jgi:UV DNA damage repair endonuclease
MAARPDGSVRSAGTRSHRLGFAVKVLGGGGLPSHDARRWQSGPHLSVSLDRLEAILDYCAAQEIGFYRMVSSFVSYATHPGLPQFHSQVEACAERLEAVGPRPPSRSAPRRSVAASSARWSSPQLRAHADLIDPIGFEHFLGETASGHGFDVMLEAKAEDLALLRLRDQLAERGIATEGGRLVVEDGRAQGPSGKPTTQPFRR